MNNNKIIKELSDSGAVNNIANRFFQLAIVVAPVIAFFADTSIIPSKFFSDDYIKLYVIFIQAIFALLIFILGEPTNKNWDTVTLQNKIKNSKYYTTNNIDEEKLSDKINFLKSYFSKYWGYLWATWALFYVIMFVVKYDDLSYPVTIKKINLTFTTSQISLEMIEDIITYLNSYFILCLYFALIHKFDSHKVKHDSSIDFHKYASTAFFMFIILIVAQLAVYLAMVDHNLWTNDNVLIVQNSFNILNGVIASICFILLISRLIGSFTTVLPYKNILLPFLFLYCSIQPLYFMVNAIIPNNDFKDHISIIVLLIALAGKYLLYISITWLFETKRILFHFLETHQLRNDMKNEIVLFDDIWDSKTPNTKTKIN